MIDITCEQLVSIRDIPRHLPRRPSGKRVHISACYRWLSRGVSGVKLEAIRIGGTTYTSVEALQRFAERLSSSTPRPLIEPAPSLSRQKMIDRAARELEKSLNPSRSGPNGTSRRQSESARAVNPQGENS